MEATDNGLCRCLNLNFYGYVYYFQFLRVRKSMEAFTHLFVFYSVFFSLFRISISLDTITPTQSLRDGGTLVSAGEQFQLGFFSPGNSKSRYVGIWYMISPETIVWVANRDASLSDRSGVLKVTDDGVLVLLNSSNGTVWSSNTSTIFPQNPVAQLLDTGNLVVKDGNVDDPEKFMWQSFDYPCDTFLPDMKLGWNLVTGLDRFISSWKSTDDPGQGEYSMRVDPRGLPQLVYRKGDSIKARAGSWNGLHLTGYHGLRSNPAYEDKLVVNEKEVYYDYSILKNSIFSRYVQSLSGVAQGFVWMDRTQSWQLFYTSLADECEKYALCGAYAICNISNSPVCTCLEGFLPKSPKHWDSADWSDGCARRTPLKCNDGDGFQQRNKVKLPDTSSSWYNKSMTLKECEGMCLKNCSCTAYASLDIRGGGSGCLLWFGSLVDIRELGESGQDLYIRMAISELGTTSLLFFSLDFVLISFLSSILNNRTCVQQYLLANVQLVKAG